MNIMTNVLVGDVPEIADRLDTLNQKIIQFLKDSKYVQEDARFITLNNIVLLILSAIMRMNVLISLKEGLITEEKIGQVFRISAEDLPSILNDEMTLTKIAFVTVFQFQIEHLFKILLSRLDKRPLPIKYYHITDRLLKILGVDNSDKLDKLNVLAYVRNCLHSNGMHYNKNKIFVIDGYDFKFVKGELFKNANWGEIHYMTNSAFNVIKEILESDIVKQLPHPLPDQYTSDNDDS